MIGVQIGSPAAGSGIRIGDIITHMAGVALDDLAKMTAVRDQLVAGVPLPVSVVRQDEPHVLAITPVHVGDFLTASTNYNLGYLYLHRLGEPEKAKPWLIASVDEYSRALLVRSSAAGAMRDGMAFAATELGTCAYRLGRAEMQEQALLQGKEVAEENVRLNPSVPRYRTSLAVNLANISTVLEQRGDLAEASTLCREAVKHLETALLIGGDLVRDRVQLVQALNNLGNITSEKDGADAAVPLFEAAIEASRPLDQADLQSMPLVLAQLHRNYASSLRRSGKLEEASEAYETAHRNYVAALDAAQPPPAWLLQELATLECWRAAMFRKLGREALALQAAGEFEARFAALEASGDGEAALARTRLAAVEAHVDAVLQLLSDDRTASEAVLRQAEDQLATAVAADADVRAAAASLLQEARQRLSGNTRPDDESGP